MPRGHGQKYTRLRELALVSLLANPTIDAAAKASGISEKCLRLWMVKPDFAAAVRDLRQQVVEAGASRLTGLVSKAIETLEGGLLSKKAADRVRAARSILEWQQKLTTKAYEEKITDLQRQIDELRGIRSGAGGVHVHGPLVGNISVAPEAFAAFLEDAAAAARRPTPKVPHPAEKLLEYPTASEGQS